MSGAACQQVVFGKVDWGTSPVYGSGLDLPAVLTLDGTSQATIAGWTRRHSSDGVLFDTPWITLRYLNLSYHAAVHLDDGAAGCDAQSSGTTASNLWDETPFPAVYGPEHAWVFVAVTWDGLARAPWSGLSRWRLFLQRKGRWLGP